MVGHERRGSRLSKGSGKKPGKAWHADMDDLPDLSLEAALDNVEMLFHLEQCSRPGQNPYSRIFSTVGPILLAVNPYEELECFSQEWREAYRDAGIAGFSSQAWRSLGPHCYALAERCYQAMTATPQQTIVVCGDSGSGKTETKQHILEYLLQADHGRSKPGGEGVDSGGVDQWGFDKNDTEELQLDLDQLRTMHALLGHFGKAKTCRNDNSTRFGLHSVVYYAGELARCQGLKMESFLLERSRVTSVPRGERNFNALYQVGAALAGGNVAKMAKFRYLGQSVHVLYSDGEEADDLDGFGRLQENLEGAGFTDEESDLMFDCLKAVLYLGNIEFQTTSEEDGASHISKATQNDAEKAAKFLGLEVAAIESALTRKKMTVAGELLELGAPMQEAVDMRDCLARHLYSSVFDRLLNSMNSKLAAKRDRAYAWLEISVLDVFGFEDMPMNGLEQLLINLANEVIQCIFYDMVFQKEAELYADQGIQSSFQMPPADEDCLELIMSDKLPGIVHLIADRVKHNMGGGDGSVFVEMALNRHLSKHKKYLPCSVQDLRKEVASKKSLFGIDVSMSHKECFQIKHYTGNIIYCARDFVSRSKDVLSDLMKQALSRSKQSVVQALCEDKESASNRTLGQRFVSQLQALRSQVERSSTSFVKCFKPNMDSQSGIFNRQLVLDQMMQGGIGTAIDARRLGMPDRVDYTDFLFDEDYRFTSLERGSAAIISPGAKQVVAHRARCKAVMQEWIVRDTGAYALGRTKIFMKLGVLHHLRGLRQFKEKLAARRIVRRWVTCKGIKQLTDLNSLDQRLSAARNLAEELDISDAQLVAEALSAADSCPIWKHQSAARKSRVDRLKTTSGKVPAFSEAEMAEAERLVAQAERIVSNVATRKKAARQHIAELIAQQRFEASELLSRIAKVDGRNVGDMRAQRREIRQKVEQFIKEDLKELQQEMEGNFDPAQAGPLDALLEAMELPASVFETLKECEDMIVELESMGQTLSKRRHSYVATLREKHPDIDSLLQQREKAQERLDGLLAGGEAFAGLEDGLESINKLVHQKMDDLNRLCTEANMADIKVDELQGDIADPDEFIAALRHFLEAEEAATAEMKKVRQYRQELEAKQNQLVDQAEHMFPRIDELRKVGSAFLGLLSEFSSDLSKKEVASSHAGDKYMEMWVEIVDAMRDRVTKACDSVSALGFLPKAPPPSATAIQADYPPAGPAPTSTTGPWSVECACRLGALAEIDDLDVEVLPSTTSVGQAVEALNSGLENVSVGFCVTWSQMWHEYVLVYQHSKFIEAHEKVPHSCSCGQGQCGFDQEAGAFVSLKSKRKSTVRDLSLAQSQLQKDFEARASRLHAESKEHERSQRAARVLLDRQESMVADAERKLRTLKSECEEQESALDVAAQQRRAEESKNAEMRQQHLTERKSFQAEAAALRTKLRSVGETIQTSQDVSSTKALDQATSLCERLHSASAALVRDLKSADRRMQGNATSLELEAKLARQDRGLSELLQELSAAGGSRPAPVAGNRVSLASAAHPESLRVLLGMSDAGAQSPAATAIAKAAGAGASPSSSSTTKANSSAANASASAPRGVTTTTTTTTRSASQSRSSQNRSSDQQKPSGWECKVKVGDRVLLLPSRQLRGVVRFVGETTTGPSVGVQLDEPRGTCDGNLGGRFYFRCQPRHGIYTKPTGVVKDLSSHVATAAAAVEQTEKIHRLKLAFRISGLPDPSLPPAPEAVKDAVAFESGEQVLPRQVELAFEPDGVVQVSIAIVGEADSLRVLATLKHSNSLLRSIEARLFAEERLCRAMSGRLHVQSLGEPYIQHPS